MGPSCAVEEDKPAYPMPEHDTLACVPGGCAECRLSSPATSSGSDGSPACKLPVDGSGTPDDAVTARPSSAHSAHTLDCHSDEPVKPSSTHAGSDTGSQSQHQASAEDAIVSSSVRVSCQAGTGVAHSAVQQRSKHFTASQAHSQQRSRGSNGQNDPVRCTEDTAAAASSRMLRPVLLSATGQQQVLHPGMLAAAATAGGPFTPGLLNLSHPGATPQHTSMLAAAAAAASQYMPLAGLGGLRALTPPQALAAQVPMFLNPHGAPANSGEAAQRHAAAVAAAHQAGTLAVMHAAAAHSALVLNSLTALHGGIPGMVAGRPTGIPAAFIGAHGAPSHGLPLPHQHAPPPAFLLAHLASHQGPTSLAGLVGTPLGMLQAGLTVGPHGLMVPGGGIPPDMRHALGPKQGLMPPQQHQHQHQQQAHSNQGAQQARAASSSHTATKTTAGGLEANSGGVMGKRSRSQTHSSTSAEQRCHDEVNKPTGAALTAHVQLQQATEDGMPAAKRIKQESCNDPGGGGDASITAPAHEQMQSSAAAVKSEDLAGSGVATEALVDSSSCQREIKAESGQMEEDVLRANEGLSSDDDDEHLPMDMPAAIRQSSLPLLPPGTAGLHAGRSMLPVMTPMPGLPTSAGGVWLSSQLNSAAGMPTLSPFSRLPIAPSVVTTSIGTATATTAAAPLTVETPPLQSCLPTAPSEPCQDEADLHSLLASLARHRRKRTHRKICCAPTARLASILSGLGLLSPAGSTGALPEDNALPLCIVDASQLATQGADMQPPVLPLHAPSTCRHNQHHEPRAAVNAPVVPAYAGVGIIASCKLQASQKGRMIHAGSLAVAAGGASKSGRRKATPSRAAD